jgi:hypothetical protein
MCIYRGLESRINERDLLIKKTMTVSDCEYEMSEYEMSEYEISEYEMSVYGMTRISLTRATMV